jgi:hypothetical protein
MRKGVTLLSAVFAIWAFAAGVASARCDTDDPAAPRKEEETAVPAAIAPAAAAAAPSAPIVRVIAPGGPPAPRVAPVAPRGGRDDAVRPGDRGAAIPDSALMRKRRIL